MGEHKSPYLLTYLLTCNLQSPIVGHWSVTGYELMITVSLLLQLGWGLGSAEIKY